MEEHKCIRCAFDWDDGDMVYFRGSRVQLGDPPLPPLHYHTAHNLHITICQIIFGFCPRIGVG